MPGFCPITKIASRQIKIFERHCSLADADRFAQRRAAGFVAHVGTVRQVVGAELAHEELIEKRGFIAGAAGGVEDRLVRDESEFSSPAIKRKRLVPTRSVRNDRCLRRKTIG